MEPTVICLSGGIDSTTLLAELINRKTEVYPIMFNYESKHNQYEIEAVWKICKYYGLSNILKVINLPFVNELFKSHLLKSGEEIPEGEYGVANIGQTIVPGRNLIFMSIAAGYAQSIGVPQVAVAVHAGDHPIYPDCRAEFVHAANRAIYLSSGGVVSVYAPYVYLNKDEIISRGYKMQQPPPYELTRSCYKNQPISCGKCATCIERIRAFQKIGMTDPIPYETQEGGN